MIWLALALACTGGPQTPEPEAGKWFAQRYRTHRFDASLTDAQRAQIELLEAIGYADGTRPVTAVRSVAVHDPDRAYQGFNFYNSGHGAEAFLVDMDGRALHRWTHAFWDTFPGYPVDRDHGGTHNFRRAWLLRGGDVLALHEGLGLVRLDVDSRVRWSYPARPHHDLDFGPDGAIWVLTREARMVTRMDRDAPILEDFLVVLDPDTGRERRRFSLLEALERSPHAGLLERREDKADLFHTNTVRLLDGAAEHLDPAFAAGNVLLSIRNLSALVVVNPETRAVVWARTGPWRLQHDPSPTRAGELLLFDNRGLGRGAARVLALRLPDLRVTWEYRGPREAPLDSGTLGAVTELPNGNVLITDSEQGRALEVDRATGDVVWAFTNPHVAGPTGEYVAALFEMMRLPPDFPIEWADGAQ